jgi:hypothetical protein
VLLVQVIDITCFKAYVGSCQSSTGFSSQCCKNSGILRWLYLVQIWFSKNEVVDSRDKLSAVMVSQDDLLGAWITWRTDPRYAPIRCAVLMKMEAYSSFLT